MNADHYCAFMHPFPPNSRMRTRLKRGNGKSSKQFQKSLFLYLEERCQLEKALYFKGVGIPKQACYQCFLRDRVKIINSCLPGKENGYCGDFVVSPLNARLNALFEDTDGNRKVQKNHR